MDQWTIDPAVPGRIRFQGDLDLANSRDLGRYLATQLDGQARQVELDLSGVEFIDSNGLHALIHAHHAATARGSQVVLVSPSPAVARLLELTGCVDVFTIVDRVEQHPTPAAD
jgi:anti-sigma B factor antagonist